jgi:site-specific DNA-methyltransferase (adenine-specific)
MKIELYNKDCFDKLKELGDNSVDAIVTDPPYFISFMNKGWDNEDSIASKKEFWAECLRVTKPGGYLLAFGHSRTHHRLFTAVEDAGWEIRDTIMWLYGSGFPKSLNIGKAIDKLKGVSKDWEGWGTALKPAHEPICMARKPIDGNVVNNIKKWGVGGINIDACRVGYDMEDKSPATNPLYRHQNADKYKQVTDGGKQVGVNVSFTNSMNPPSTEGRFPANIILDEEAGTILDEGTDSASRFFYCAKVSGKERGEGNNHPTVKPIALMEYLIKLVSKEEAIILDPFMGSGSTGIAAKKMNRSFIGIEMDEGYHTIASKRIGEDKKE